MKNNQEYNPNPITSITKALVCHMTEKGYKPKKIAQVLGRSPEQIRNILCGLKSSGNIKNY